MGSKVRPSSRWADLQNPVGDVAEMLQSLGLKDDFLLEGGLD